MGSNNSAKFSVLDLSLSTVFPNVASESDDDIGAYQSLVEHVLPNFKSNVLFVLLEVLGLERLKSKAETLVYSTLGEEEAEKLVAVYFNLIDQLFEGRNWTLSAVDNLYFDPTVWCAEIIGQYSGDEEATTPSWYESKRPKTLRRSYADANSQSLDELQVFFREYVEKLQSFYEHGAFKYLGHFPYSYVLLIPVALNSSKLPVRRKVAAIFLHFSCKEQLEPVQLLSIYQQIILYWHHHYTAEALELQRKESASYQREATVLKKVKESIDDLRGHLESFHKPLRTLVDAINPVRGLIFGGQNCSALFQTGKVMVGHHQVDGCHDWSTIDRNWNLDKKKELVAAIMIVTLGCATTATYPFWPWLIEYVEKARNGDDALMTALAKHIPEITMQNPPNDRLKSAFDKLKLWFNTAYKHDYKVGLPYDLLAVAFESWGVLYELPSEAVGDCFWVASESPIDTIDALASLHSSFGFDEARLVRSDNGRLNTLTLPLTGGVSDCEKLAEAVETARRSGAARGNTAPAICRLFGKSGKFNISDSKEMYTFKGLDDHEANLILGTDEIVISWKGPLPPC